MEDINNINSCELSKIISSIKEKIESKDKYIKSLLGQYAELNKAQYSEYSASFKRNNEQKQGLSYFIDIFKEDEKYLRKLIHKMRQYSHSEVKNKVKQRREIPMKFVI